MTANAKIYIMEQAQIQNQDDYRSRAINGMDEYDRITEEWNNSNHVQERRNHRRQMINNTEGYRTGDRIHHIRSMQMYNHADWNALFGNEMLDPILREYAQASIDWVQNPGQTRFAGQMEVSLLMQENYRPGVHIAIFIIHLCPHRRFQDGHIIYKEFSEGSNTHQTINRLFDTDTRAIVLQATQYQLLDFLANDDDAMDLLHTYFFDDDFSTMKFAFVPSEDPEDEYLGYYVLNPYANDDHRWHDCAEEAILQEHIPEPVAQTDAIPPPPPVNDFAAIYFRHLAELNAENQADAPDDNDDDDDEIMLTYRPNPQRNIIQYMYNDEDEELPARG